MKILLAQNEFCKGFTIIELMITLALVSVLVTFGIPGFSGLMERNQLTTGINKFVSSLSLARSEAIKRNQRIGLCASSNGEQCADVGFENGWLVYVDNNQNNNRESDEELIWVVSKYGNNFTLRGSSGYENTIFYLPSGRIATNVNGNIRLCKDNDVKKARMLNLITTGRVQQARRNDQGIPQDNAGNVIEGCNLS